MCKQLYGQVHDKRITGKVVDQNHLPISLATISLYDHSEKLVLSTATDRLGQFQMKFDQAGRYFVKVRHIGHQDQQSPVFEWSTIDLGTFTLVSLANTLAEVAVEGKKK
ncbi:carboxypeptidase-like regulatory domain-containing protein [Sphingobacterium sp. KU25419]|nr:carboxypeptidase-like regulatory domain-containing protein [Sphingobacterium sp. KU25419]